MKPRDTKTKLTVERLRSLLSYDHRTGLFWWQELPSSRASNIKVGQLAGAVENTGYIRICIDGTRYQAHRLAWLHFYGEWPVYRLDHINNIQSDNRIDNLRQSDDFQNSANRRLARNNITGAKGVELHASGKYRPRLGRKSLGLYDTLEEAKRVYDAAAVEKYGPFARLR